MADHGLQIKLVVVGDGGSGKTCLLISYCKDEFPTTYVPTVFDTYPTKVEVDSRKVQLTLWDTAGQEDYDKMRPMAYPNTDVFLLCFSLISKDSLVNVEKKWVPELRHRGSGWEHVPILLVGLKKDLREERPQDAVAPDRGPEVAKKISAVGYMECSAKTREGVGEVFAEAIRALLRKTKTKKSDSGKCSLL